jgi:REP element-mobilizing transposase RayT
MRYLITFACYGARLHGDESGSVDRHHNLVGSHPLAPDPHRVAAVRREMPQQPYLLYETARVVVLSAIQNHCAFRGWSLLAAHIRSNHVHAIVDSAEAPERIMTEFKSYASRELNRLELDGPVRKRWARHGSTRWLWKDDDVRNALRYVIHEQGEAMALFVSQEIERNPTGSDVA